jgi:hypothetical protein
VFTFIVEHGLPGDRRKETSNVFMYFWQFAAKICLLTSFRDTCFVEIVPQYQAPQRGKIPFRLLISEY